LKGLESHFIESLARAYAGQNVDVTVFVPYIVNSSRLQETGDGVKIVNFRYLPFAGLHTIGSGNSMRADLRMNLKEVLLMPFFLIAGVLRFSALLRREKFDLVHAHWAVPNSLVAIFGKFLASSQAKVFTSFPGSDVTVIRQLGRFGRMLAKIIAKSDYLSCNSSDLREELVKAGFDKKNIDFVIYGVDEKKIFFSDLERVQLRGALGISEDDTVLLLVGRFVPKKGFSTAFQALKYITECKKI